MKKPVQKWQLVTHWICIAVWLVLIIIDLLWESNRALQILHIAAAVCLAASAIITMQQYRKAQREDYHD